MNSKKIIFIFLIGLTVLTSKSVKQKRDKEYMKKDTTCSVAKKNIEKAHKIRKKVLKNGLTILVYPSHRIPKVMLSVWCNVGSKQELAGEKGIAHFIEHLIFKGDGKLFFEPDMTNLAAELGAATNAFTGFDYTGYYFYLPTQHWKLALPAFRSIMTEPAFNEEHINSEMKAVIQELKMRKEIFSNDLALQMLRSIFPDHPYNYPVIGYKQDLWNMYSQDLKNFYKKHYVPNNLTFIVTGDVDPEEVFAESEYSFGDLKEDPSYKKEFFNHGKDIVSKSITLYRAVKQPIVSMFFEVPGTSTQLQEYWDVLSIALSNLKSSRLHKKLVDELKLVTRVSAGAMPLFDAGIFGVDFQPIDESVIPEVEEIIFKELESIAQCGLSEKELKKAVKVAKKQKYALLESIQQQAMSIGTQYLATQDEESVFRYLEEPLKQIGEKIKDLAGEYLRRSVVYKGYVLSLPDSEREAWLKMQQESDAQDTEFLEKRKRTAPIEEAKYSKQVKALDPADFNFKQSKKIILKNNVPVFFVEESTTPTVTIIIDFKADPTFDPIRQQGLNNFMMSMLLEGTKNYSGAEFAEAIESDAIVISPGEGVIVVNALKEDLGKALAFVKELVTNATFPTEEIEKVRTNIFTHIKGAWDNQGYIAYHLACNEIYGDHPYAKDYLGSKESIASITRKDLVKAYKKYVTPDKARIAVVGDIEGIDIESEFNDALGSWNGEKAQEIKYPKINPIKEKTVHYPIERDQMMLMLAAPTVSAVDKDYDALLLFTQIYAGGSVGSMSSRLFALREETGLFYTIGGSAVTAASEQPGIFCIRTFVSMDRLEEAEKEIKRVTEEAIVTITEQELITARRALCSAMVNCFGSNGSIASSLLKVDKLKLPEDYYKKRFETLSSISLQDVKDAAKRHIDTKKMITIKVGREVETSTDKKNK